MYPYVKRCLDIIFSAILLIPVGVVLLLSAIAIKLDDGGPVFYMAERSGLNGKPFRMYKLRSMMVDAPDIRMADGSTYNAEDDPRVTRFGRFARKTSIDELPQILNILKGDMSFIGPRPDSASYLPYYEPEERAIFNVRPGITGYNQVINRNASGTKEKIRNDLYYVEHVSFLFDLKILWMTFSTVLSQKNVYRDTAGENEAAETEKALTEK